MKWPYIDFMGKRYILFAISAVLMVVAAGSLAINGLNLGIEFEGGTIITLTNTKATIGECSLARRICSSILYKLSSSHSEAGAILRFDATASASSLFA